MTAGTDADVRHNVLPALLDSLVPLADLEPHPHNARRRDERAEAELRNSMRVNGQYRRIVVRRLDDGRLQTLAGHGTAEAARQLEWTHIAAEVHDHVDDEHAARIVAVDNKTGDMSDDDPVALLELLESMGSLEGSGFVDDYVDELRDQVSALLADPDEPAALTDPDDIPEPPVDPVTKPGDVWLLGPHRVIAGDCRQAGVLERVLDGRRATIAFTSPPYASQRRYDETSDFEPVRPDDYVEWFAAVQEQVAAVLADDGSWFVNIKEHCDAGQRHLYVKDLTIAHVRRWGWLLVDELCWVDAKNGVPGGWPNRFKDAWEPVFHYARSSKIKFRPLGNGTESDAVFDYSSDTATTRTGSGLLGVKATEERAGIARPSNVLTIAASAASDHSAMFPTALPAWFLRSYTDPGDLVLDPFIGAGTTLLAAHAEQRVCAGVEISPRYVDVVCRRWQEHTGVPPVLEATGEEHDFG